MMLSTLYSQCPGCHERALVEDAGGAWRCAACAFDYGALARDDAAREAWMLDNLRRGPMGQLAVIHLHRVLRGLPLQASNDAVKAFAAKNGIALPTGGGISAPWMLAGLIFGAIALIGVASYVVFSRWG